MSLFTAENYESLDVIGRGAFGTVRRIRRKADGLILARKEISYTKMEIKERKQLVAEFEILAQLKHPNIIQYFHREHLKSDQMLHLYMEHCGNGDLASLVRRCKENKNSIPESYIWTVCVQLVTALFFCHNGYDAPEPDNIFALTKGGTPSAPIPTGKPLVKVLHRDLKPENIFMMEDNSIKLGDFGLAKLLQPGQCFAQTYAGTPNYMSPEIINGRSYTSKSDIWSVGCILYELCALEVPFTAFSLPQLVLNISSGHYNPIPSCYTRRLAKVIEMCLRVEPRDRASAGDLLQEETVRLFIREMRIVETAKRLKAKEEETMRKETLLQARADEMERMYAECRKRIEQDIDSKLRAEWEVRADALIKQKIELKVFSIRSELESRFQKRLADEVQARLEAEVQARIAAMNLVPCEAAPSNGSQGDSGFDTGPSSPDRPRYPVLAPNSPADITMGSPSPHLGRGAQLPNLLKFATHWEPPPKMPLKLNHPFSDNNLLFEKQDRASTPTWPVPQPATIRAAANNVVDNPLERQPLTANVALINMAAKRGGVTTNANGSPARVAMRTRTGLQRAETTGGFPAMGGLVAGYGIGGSGGSSDDIATVKLQSLIHEPTKYGPKSLVQISQEQAGRKRNPYGPPAVWAEEAGDLPSPFKKERRPPLSNHQ